MTDFLLPSVFCIEKMVEGRVRAGGGGCHALSTRATAGPSKLGPKRGRPAEKLE